MKKIILVAAIIFFGFLAYNYFYNSIVSRPGESGEDLEFVIGQGESAAVIAKRLEESGLVSSAYFFRRYLEKNGLGEKIQAGSYGLNQAYSIKEIAVRLSSGQVINEEKSIRTIEGWRIKDIDEYLAKENIISAGQFSGITDQEIGNWKLGIDRPDFLSDAPSNASLEGFLFPDTYRIFNDARAGDIAIKMLKNFDQKLSAELRAEIKRQGKGIFEIVTLASIIEKEVRSEQDMRMVSGIFWNRLNNQHALESCATLAYILGVQKPVYSIEDTNVDSPYNTYRHLGLPPGPIGNPGLKAIMAAVYPEENDYFYFLSRSDNGETVYSRTYEEHLKNKERYLR